ncbi:MAG: cellulase family glycosylhydrolase [Bacteroidales bacterium]|nr:cellulase family glycosylhydrolase [Bacteroidales bacterium]
MKKLILIPLFFFFIQSSQAQVPFHRGVNLTNWFQADNARKIQFRKYTKKDFMDIKSLGCDVIRLPINLHGMTSGAPDYTIDPLFISFLDSAVNWAEELNLYLLIDNHSFDPAVNTSPDIGQILTKVWPQLAEYYKNRSNYIIYEILNEPHGITNQLWGSIQQQTIDAIRSKDTKHTIIVGPSGYNGYNDLAQMPVYTDQNLIYTFHFYDPFLFTHQGASWSTPSMEPLSGVPFPYAQPEMPVCPPSLVGTWIQSSLNNYSADGTVAKVKSLIDIAVNFRNTRNINIFCGEFGVYIPNSDNADRAFWYQTVKDYLDLKSIPWTIWDYKGGFGIFEKGSSELFESDLNIPLLGALGFNIPEQHSQLIKPDSVGFRIYDDYIGQGIQDASYSSGTIDYYSYLLPNNDRYCLYWSGGPQYTAVSLDFVPDKDLSRLVSSGYALDMIVRGNTTGIKFDIRFLDSKTSDPLDHPWRMRVTLDGTIPGWDKRWHHLHIPLTQFTEHGAWDNNTWYTPTGKFDWSAIDRMEIVSEYGSIDGKEVWFDNIMITDQDTASVVEAETLGINAKPVSGNSPGLILMPNPMKESTLISGYVPESGLAKISIYSINGQKITDLVNKTLPEGTFNVQWYGNNDHGNKVADGIYICRLTTNNVSKYVKLIKQSK